MKGESVKLSAKFAILSREAQEWHGRTLSFSAGNWRTNTRIKTSQERFFSLINSSINGSLDSSDIDCLISKEIPPFSDTDYSYADKVSLLSKFLIGFINLKEGKRKRDIYSAVRNYINIVGSTEENSVLAKSLLNPRFCKAWVKFKRGKDLFYFGKFNIPETILACDGEDGGLHSPSVIISQAYGIPHYYTEEIFFPRTHSRRGMEHLGRYMKRYKAWFLEGDNFNRIDELTAGQRLDIFLRIIERRNGKISPVNLFAEVNAETQRREEARRTKMNRPPMLKYEWVDKVFQEVHTKQGTLLPIRTRKELKMVAEKLDNCAFNYADRLEDGESLFVYLKKNGQVKALAEYRPDESMTQCLGVKNTKVNGVIAKVFKDNKPDFKAWRKVI